MFLAFLRDVEKRLRLQDEELIAVLTEKHWKSKFHLKIKDLLVQISWIEIYKFSAISWASRAPFVTREIKDLFNCRAFIRFFLASRPENLVKNTVFSKFFLEGEEIYPSNPPLLNSEYWEKKIVPTLSLLVSVLRLSRYWLERQLIITNQNYKEKKNKLFYWKFKFELLD